jgi:hypothetical protein
MSNYTCTSCGESFPTLTTKRLHQRECSEAEAEFDVDGMDPDEMAGVVVDELLVCDVCESKNGGAESLDWDITAAGLAFTLTFTCENCGAWNENEAILA